MYQLRDALLHCNSIAHQRLDGFVSCAAYRLPRLHRHQQLPKAKSERIRTINKQQQQLFLDRSVVCFVLFDGSTMS